MIRLIVNADDLGCGPGRDTGIFRGFANGIVTSASILANGKTILPAAKKAAQLCLPVGVHLNLSEGRPLTGEIPGITLPNGDFPGKSGLRRRLGSGVPLDTKAIREELRRQVERIFELGLKPDHLDTHQHFFLFPSITDLVLDLAEEMGIRALRLPLPAEPKAEDPPGLQDDLKLYRHLAPTAAERISARPLYTPQGLWGMPALDRMDSERLERLLVTIPPGNWELMVHPGECDPGHPFSGAERTEELEALISPRIREIIGERSIDLTTFGELSCAY